MPKGPFGFSRFTNIGPFVEEDDILKDFIKTKLKGAGAEEIEVTNLKEEVVFDFYMDMRRPSSYKSSIAITNNGVRKYTLRYSRLRTSDREDEEVKKEFERAINECDMPEGAGVRYADLYTKLAPHVEQGDRSGPQPELEELVEFIECSTRKVKEAFPRDT